MPHFLKKIGSGESLNNFDCHEFTILTAPAVVSFEYVKTQTNGYDDVNGDTAIVNRTYTQAGQRVFEEGRNGEVITIKNISVSSGEINCSCSS